MRGDEIGFSHIRSGRLRPRRALPDRCRGGLAESADLVLYDCRFSLRQPCRSNIELAVALIMYIREQRKSM